MKRIYSAHPCRWDSGAYLWLSCKLYCVAVKALVLTSQIVRLMLSGLTVFMTVMPIKVWRATQKLSVPISHHDCLRWIWVQEITRFQSHFSMETLNLYVLMSCF